jgi:hypothetical protein
MPTLTLNASRHTVIDRRKDQYLCFPDVVKTADGRLIVAYNEYDQHVGTRRKLLLKTSTDNGKTWSKAKYMDMARSHCPRLTRLHNDELILSDDCGPTFRRSMNNGTTWEVHTAPGIQHSLLDRIIDLDNDVLLTTGHSHRGSFPHPAIRQASTEQMVYRSENRGQTWKPLSVLAHHRNLVLCEASMTRLADGRLIALMRENSFVYEPMYLCISENDGGLWSDPIPTPLIGHRPTMGLVPDGRLLVTYRNVGPDAGTCAWLGTLDELTSDFKVHARAANPDNPILTQDGLRVRNEAGENSVVRYALRPLTDPRSATATLEAEVRVDMAGKNGCGLRLGAWWRLYPDKIVPDVENAEPIAIEPGRFNTIRLDYENGVVTLAINNEKRAAIAVGNDHADTRPILFGTPASFEDNEVDCTWKRVRLETREPVYQRAHVWDWTAQDGLPDQWVRDHILELKNDRHAASPDFGYSGWITLDDGTFFCVYHHGGGDEKGYTPMESAHVLGTHFSLDDFK